MPDKEMASEIHDVQTTLEGGKLEEDWSFAKADTTVLSHGLHEYPARMIPQIARRLILRYTHEQERILDPFCGSGTTLVEARLCGRHAVGIDINPLAVLIAKVKVTPIDFVSTSFDVHNFLSNLESNYLETKKNGKLPEPPLHVHPNLLHWFKEDVARELEFLYQKITHLKNSDVRDLLMVVLSDTIFRCSNIDHRSSRFIRILPDDELSKFKPDVFGYFRRKLIDSVSRVSALSKELQRRNESNLEISVTARKGDARKLRFSKDTFDVVITSPPYGEEKNTVGYARWSKLSVAWLRLNHEELKESERRSLGFTPVKDVGTKLKELPSPTAKTLLSELFLRDQDRVKDALPFFFEYFTTLKQMHKVLKPNGFCCIVIGDRSIRQRPLDMEKVTVELGRNAGFDHVESYFREIPMKLIPWTTPTGKTIARESIIVLRKRERK